VAGVRNIQPQGGSTSVAHRWQWRKCVQLLMKTCPYL